MAQDLQIYHVIPFDIGVELDRFPPLPLPDPLKRVCVSHQWSTRCHPFFRCHRKSHIRCGPRWKHFLEGNVSITSISCHPL